jgi:hypothetical protein
MAFFTGSSRSISAMKRNPILSREEIMNIVEKAGMILALKLDQRPEACKGLMIVAIRASVGVDWLYATSYEDLVRACNVFLKRQLEEVGIQDANGIASTIIDETSKICNLEQRLDL